MTLLYLIELLAIFAVVFVAFNQAWRLFVGVTFFRWLEGRALVKEAEAEAELRRLEQEAKQITIQSLEETQHGGGTQESRGTGAQEDRRSRESGTGSDRDPSRER